MGEASPSACIDPDTAARYADHQLAEAETRTVEHHIDTCSGCRELLSALAKAQFTQSSSSDDGDDSARDPAAVLPRGTAVGPYEIERPLDAGGMGLVYVARDPRLDRAIALKAVRDRRGAAELLREGRMMARLAHPNVVPVYDVIEAHDQIFIAMELVAGRSVRQWLADERHGWRAIVDVFAAAGAGLAAAHAAGIVHGDVKPANMLHGDDGRVRITDFGLASGSDGDREHGTRGTPAYMAPEQRTGTACDALGDQYAFSASLHEALFGALPGAPAVHEPRIPRAVRRVLVRGLAATPDARYPSMDRLLRALRSAVARRWRWIAAGVAAAAAVGIVAYATGERRVTARLCEASAPELASPWTPDARFAVRRSFDNTKLAYAPQILARVEDNLDRWTADLDRTRTALCDPGLLGRDTQARLAPQLGCLEDRAREVRALVGLFRDTSDATTVLNAVAATEQLGSPARCADDAPPPPPADVSLARRGLSDRFAQTFALMAAGRFRQALPLSKALVDAATATGDPHARAASLVALGRNQVALSDYEAARATLLEAIRLAELARDDRLRVQAYVNLMTAEYQRGHYDQARVLQPLALGAAERVGDVYLQTELLVVGGMALAQIGKPGEAQPLFEQAVRLRRELYGDRSSRIASPLTALGNAYAMQGDLAKAAVAHEQAAAISEAALGSTHPDVGTAHANLGDDYLYGLRIELAVAELGKAVAILEAAHGSKTRQVAGALTDLGLAQLEAGQLETAEATLDRAEAIWAAVVPKHPARAEALLGRYLAREALHRPLAVADLETALVLGQQLPPFERARIQLALGRAITGERSAKLIADAIVGLSSSTLPLIQRDLQRARAWQAEHPR